MEIDPVYESMMSELAEAENYFCTHLGSGVFYGSELYKSVDKYGLNYEVFTMAYRHCKALENRVERQLSEEEIGGELSYAAFEWDV